MFTPCMHNTIMFCGIKMMRDDGEDGKIQWNIWKRWQLKHNQALLQMLKSNDPFSDVGWDNENEQEHLVELCF